MSIFENTHIVVGIVLGFAVFNILNIVKIAYAASYKDEMECHSSMIDPYTWLFLDGLVNMLAWFVAGLLCLCGNVGIIIAVILIILKFMFAFAWLIIGSIMYWRDCYGKLPSPIDNLIMAVLIISYVLFNIK